MKQSYRTLPFVFIYFLGLLFLGCSSQKPLLAEQSVQEKDSIWVEKKVIVRDTVFITDTAQVVERISVPVFKERLNSSEKDFKPILKKQGNATLKIERKWGQLEFTAECDSLQIAAELNDTYTDKHQTKEKTITITKIEKERYVPWWVKILAYVGAGSLSLLAIKTILRSIKIPF